MTLESMIMGILIVAIFAEVTYLVIQQSRRTVTRTKRNFMLVDTSVLIDGRILAVAASGFIGDTLAIPRSVTRELQLLADGSSADKRSRARYGLDVVKELQEMEGVNVIILNDEHLAHDAGGVDERLITLAKQYSGSSVCTIDYNLNKVAAIEGVRVVNVNELAQQLRMSYLPGERILLELTQKGQDTHQAIGHLKDGTMVVVEHAAKRIGQSVEIEFIRSLQTAAGKMMFAKLVEKQQEKKIQQPKESIVKQRSTGRRPQPVVSVQTSAVTPPAIKKTQPVTKQKSKTLSKMSSPQPKRRSGRVDHEAALIDLVDKQ